MVTLADRLTTDLGRVFSTSELAIDVTITHTDGSTRTFPCHFERDWISAGAAEYGADVGVPQEIFMPHPALICKDTDVNVGVGQLAVQKGETVTIGSETFRVRGLQPDGTGITEVVLWQQ